MEGILRFTRESMVYVVRKWTKVKGSTTRRGLRRLVGVKETESPGKDRGWWERKSK